MTYPADFHQLVESLALAKKKLENLEIEAGKIPAAKDQLTTITAKVVKILDANGFDEEAIDLLIAAR